MAELGLSEAHKELVLDFLKFSRYKRSQCLKDVDSAVQDVADSRLHEETFTSDEVKELLDGLCAVLKADVGSDLIHSSHTSALLLRQLFQQAEHWHLKLKVDLSELESGELLDKIAHFEQQELNVLSGGPLKHRQLEPLNSTGGDRLLQMEIERLKTENGKLLSRLASLEEKATNALAAKDQLQEDLLLQQNSPIQTAKSDIDTQSLQQKISHLQLELNEAKTTQPISDATLVQELEATSHQLLEVTDKLEKTESELKKKFNDTAQYNNMRKMMETKTATIQALRSKLKETGK